MISSRVLAGEWVVAGQCKRREPGGGERKDHEQGSRSRQMGHWHSKGIWDADETERDLDVINRGFPHQRYKPGKWRPNSTRSPAR